MGYGVSLLVSGGYALFTRPEMKGERVSYDVITPSAARGVLEAIYWHPGLCWQVDKITVLNPIRFDTVRRNEVGHKIPPSAANAVMKGGPAPHQYAPGDRQQRASLLLRNVSYIIDAHFSIHPEKMRTPQGESAAEPMPDPAVIEKKFYNIFLRRAREGQCFHQPYFGCREFPAFFQLIEEGAARPKSAYAEEEKRDLGWMLRDIEYTEKPGKGQPEYSFQPQFFRAVMERGVITVPKEGTV